MTAALVHENRIPFWVSSEAFSGAKGAVLEVPDEELDSLLRCCIVFLQMWWFPRTAEEKAFSDGQLLRQMDTSLFYMFSTTFQLSGLYLVAEVQVIERDPMEQENDTEVTQFILLGFSCAPQTKIVLLMVLVVFYLTNVAANSLFIIVVLSDSRLRTPMYFFLCNLSILDFCLSSFNTPTVLEGLLVQRITIIYSQCMAQMFFSLWVGESECFLLAVMGLDRYVAICNPLRYQQIMSNRVCITLAVAIWSSAFLLSLPTVAMLPFIHFCGHNTVDHLVCELHALSQLTCMDSQFSRLSAPMLAFFSLVAPMFFIIFTYLRIIAAILRMPTAESRRRTFATCGSHLVVVILFYGTAMVIYLRPKSRASSETDKTLALFYGQVVPALNPLIYTLRNKEVKVSLKNLYSKAAVCRVFGC
ncbi:olfactory receptor 2D2-like [Ambystoma mexicanum]|uniref:olfactory receptor 2D2-like n=1 Tax=Ambystoma mexicanum TaxID=8296 RepID=UPI0037E867C3